MCEIVYNVIQYNEIDGIREWHRRNGIERMQL